MRIDFSCSSKPFWKEYEQHQKKKKNAKKIAKKITKKGIRIVRKTNNFCCDLLQAILFIFHMLQLHFTTTIATYKSIKSYVCRSRGI